MTDEPLIRAVPMPEAETPGDEDPRPRWERANMPKGEWERALRSSDAAVARVEPGSPEFSRLMEVRVQLHFPPPQGISLGDIDRYKQAQFEKVAGADLSRELARMGPRPPAWQRYVIVGVSACSVALVVYFVWSLATERGAETPVAPTAAARATAAQPVVTATATAEAAAPTAPAPTIEPAAPATATATPRVGGLAPPKSATAPAPPTAAPPPTAKPTATGVKPFFD